MATSRVINLICGSVFISLIVCKAVPIKEISSVSCNFKDGFCEGWGNDGDYQYDLQWEPTEQTDQLNITKPRPGQIILLEVPEEAEDNEVENCLSGFMNSPRVSIEGKFSLHLSLWTNIKPDFSYVYVYLEHFYPDRTEFQYIHFDIKNTQNEWKSYSQEGLESSTEFNIQVEGNLCARTEKVAIAEIIINQDPKNTSISCDFKEGICDGWYLYYEDPDTDLDWKAADQSQVVDIPNTRPGNILLLEAPDNVTEDDMDEGLAGYIDSYNTFSTGNFSLYIKAFILNFTDEQMMEVYAVITDSTGNEHFEPIGSNEETEPKWKTYTAEFSTNQEFKLRFEGRLHTPQEKIAIEEISVIKASN